VSPSQRDYELVNWKSLPHWEAVQEYLEVELWTKVVLLDGLGVSSWLLVKRGFPWQLNEADPLWAGNYTRWCLNGIAFFSLISVVDNCRMDQHPGAQTVTQSHSWFLDAGNPWVIWCWPISISSSTMEASTRGYGLVSPPFYRSTCLYIYNIISYTWLHLTEIKNIKEPLIHVAKYSSAAWVIDQIIRMATGSRDWTWPKYEWKYHPKMCPELAVHNPDFFPDRS
jgi:hypothetical protein